LTAREGREVDFIGLRNRIIFWSLVVTFLYGYLFDCLLRIFIYGFDGRMHLFVLYHAGVTSLIIFPPIIIFVVRRFSRLREAVLAWERAREGDGERRLSASAAAMRSLERYPLDIALVGLAGGMVLYLEDCLSLFLFGRMNGALVLLYFLSGLCVVLTTAFLLFTVVHHLLGGVRRRCYAGFPSDLRLKGIDIGPRFVALVALLIILSIGLTSETGMARTVFIIRKQVGRSAVENASRLAEKLEGMGLEGGDVDERDLAEAAAPLALYPDEYVMVVDASARPVWQATLGGFNPGDLPDDFRDDLREKASGGGTGYLVGPRGRALASYVPLGSDGLGLVVAVPLDPFMGDANRMVFYLAMVGLMIMVVTLVSGYLTLRSAAAPLKRLEEASRRAGEGDLSTQLDIATADEVGRLSSSFRNMLSSLRAALGASREVSELVMQESASASESAEQVNASLEQLSRIIQQLSRNAAVETEHLERISSAMREMMGVIEESYDQSNRGVEINQSASQVAEAGLVNANSAVSQMEKVQSIIQEAARSIASLQEKTEQIGTIVDLIQSIADQTNLLALNAAIEAARAQEFGRGFAVVAEEVRKLAEESAQATSRISGLVREIEAGTAQSVSFMEKSRQEVSAGVEQVRETGSSLDGIFELVTQAVQLSGAIAAITHRSMQQSEVLREAVDEVSRIIESNAASAQEVSASIEEQSAAMQELAGSSEQVARLSRRLREQGDVFRL
jgi:methyl-accepting chemotaxis protein